MRWTCAVCNETRIVSSDKPRSALRDARARHLRNVHTPAEAIRCGGIGRKRLAPATQSIERGKT
eukprot:9816212-Alexandrium_andersonii.AAC.1